jgi:hypothetical protein
VNQKPWDRKIAVGAMCVLLLTVGSGVIASGKAVPKGNTLTFVETFKDKEVCIPNEGCHKAQPYLYTIKATIVLSNVNLATFGPTTSFDLSLGGLSVTNKLGDDPMYISGKTSATFMRTELNSVGKTVTYFTVRLKWTTSLLTITITGKSSDLFQSISSQSWRRLMMGTSPGLSPERLTASLILTLPASYSTRFPSPARWSPGQ